MKFDAWTAVWFCLLPGLVFARLGYLESSNGFRDNPRLDGGRSELELADVNDDGNIDIISIGDHGSPYINTQEHGVMVWFGNGDGSWFLQQYGNFGYGGVAVGDVNNDGFADVAYGMHHNYSTDDLGDQLVETALGDGTGRVWLPFDDSLAIEGQDWGMFATDMADVDNDGDLDIGSISFGADDGLHVYLNLGNGVWRRSFGFLGGNSQMEFYFRDVNRDGNADIIAAHGTGSVWFGDGTGSFLPAGQGLPSSPFGLAGLSAGDVDGDGGCDVAFANSNGGVAVYVWDDGIQLWRSFTGSLPVTGPYQATALCDMDADGFADLLAFGRGQLRIWCGDGMGNWAEAAAFTTPSPGTYAALRTGADFDHNGRPDIVLWAREGSWPNDINVAHAFRESILRDSLSIFPVFPRGGERFAAGSAQFVDWWSSVPRAESTRVRIELSSRGPNGPWVVIADSLRNDGRYQWVVPSDVRSSECHLRYTVYGLPESVQAVTPGAFVIGDTVTVLKEVFQQLLPGTVSLSPNPARYRASLAGLTGPVQYLLLDAAGRVVRSGKLARAEDGLGVVGLADGVYMVRVQGAGRTFRLVIQH